MKKLSVAIILIGFGCLFVSLVLSFDEIVVKPEEGLASLSYTRLNRKSEGSEITIFAVGDIMLDRGVEYMINKEGKGDFKFPFLRIARDLKKADILMGNLEGPISERGTKVGSIHSFRMDPQVIEGLKYAGFDVLSLANNHAVDYGRFALKDTMDILKDNGIDYLGAGLDEKEAFSVKVREVRGQKIGFLAYTDLGSPALQAKEGYMGLAWVGGEDIERVKKEIREVKSEVDILIISLHSGEEYASDPNDFQQDFSRACIDAGADIVIGHHPHVVQKIEEYEGGWIAYSLGNFVFDQGFSEETMKGLLLEIKIINGKIEEINPKEFKISQVFQPYFED